MYGLVNEAEDTEDLVEAFRYISSMYDALNRADNYCGFASISGGEYKSADVLAVSKAWANANNNV